jgi:hypothetical protein
MTNDILEPGKTVTIKKNGLLRGAVVVGYEGLGFYVIQYTRGRKQQEVVHKVNFI